MPCEKHTVSSFKKSMTNISLIKGKTSYPLTELGKGEISEMRKNRKKDSLFFSPLLSCPQTCFKILLAIPS